MGVDCIPFITVQDGICMVTRHKMENWLVRQQIYAITAFIQSKSVEKVHSRLGISFLLEDMEEYHHVVLF
jgi:hypothetical protein